LRLGKPDAKEAWAQQEAADLADEAKLKNQLMICAIACRRRPTTARLQRGALD
jgi:hypothetical protein